MENFRKLIIPEFACMKILGIFHIGIYSSRMRTYISRDFDA